MHYPIDQDIRFLWAQRVVPHRYLEAKSAHAQTVTRFFFLIYEFRTAGTGRLLHGSGMVVPLWRSRFIKARCRRAVSPPSAQLVSLSLPVSSASSACFMPTGLQAPSEQQPPCIGFAPEKQTRQALLYMYATASISSQSTAPRDRCQSTVLMGVCEVWGRHSCCAALVGLVGARELGRAKKAHPCDLSTRNKKARRDLGVWGPAPSFFPL